jgi:hypothetical protein
MLQKRVREAVDEAMVQVREVLAAARPLGAQSGERGEHRTVGSEVLLTEMLKM